VARQSIVDIHSGIVLVLCQGGFAIIHHNPSYVAFMLEYQNLLGHATVPHKTLSNFHPVRTCPVLQQRCLMQPISPVVFAVAALVPAWRGSNSQCTKQ
jgi:hypothetical protein